MRPAIAVIADDLTGAADIAGLLARLGVATALIVGPPGRGQRPPSVEAVVVGLRIRTAPVGDAIDLASSTAQWLLTARPDVLAWKVCSTFDSTPAGNIGPVADALLGLTGLAVALVCPAFPENGRTVEDGRLLVDGIPLDRTSMRHHPLTPMRDADLCRLLVPQVADPARVVRLPSIGGGAADAIDAARAAGSRYVVADARDDREAAALGEAVVGRALPVIASGLIPGIVRGLRSAGRLGPGTARAAPAAIRGPAVVLAGSCSVATRGQIAAFAVDRPVIRLRLDAPDPAGEAVAAARAAMHEGAEAVAVVASDDPAGVERARRMLGPRAGDSIERWLGEVASTLAGDGVRRIIVAGGETSGAVLAALGARELRVGAEIAPGVPVLERVATPRMLIVAKSGNFGGPDLFERALTVTAPVGLRA